jgi:predicted nucleic acid-binding protein
VWWGTEVECASAITRHERAGDVGVRTTIAALERLDELKAVWQEVLPHDAVRALARRLVRVHDLRAGDALQLSAALHSSEEVPGTLPFVTRDRRLERAAGREGFPVVVPGD